VAEHSPEASWVISVLSKNTRKLKIFAFGHLGTNTVSMRFASNFQVCSTQIGSQGFVFFFGDLTFNRALSFQYTSETYCFHCMQQHADRDATALCCVLVALTPQPRQRASLKCFSLDPSSFLDHALDNWHNGAVFLSSFADINGGVASGPLPNFITSNAFMQAMTCSLCQLPTLV